MPEEQIDDLGGLAEETARELREFTAAVREVAAGERAEIVIPVLLLVLARLQVTGARLGAIRDVVPDERFEPDTGPEDDHDALRVSLANLFEGLDDYADVVDPITAVELSRASIADDLTGAVASIDHGLAHHAAGRPVEALWWWQFGYLSEWGPRSAAVLRVLQTILGHLRQDVDDEVASQAQFDALHP